MRPWPPIPASRNNTSGSMSKKATHPPSRIMSREPCPRRDSNPRPIRSDYVSKRCHALIPDARRVRLCGLTLNSNSKLKLSSRHRDIWIQKAWERGLTETYEHCMSLSRRSTTSTLIMTLPQCRRPRSRSLKDGGKLLPCTINPTELGTMPVVRPDPIQSLPSTLASCQSFSE